MFKNLPLQKRLMALMLLTSGAVLLLTCGGFSAYEFLTYRHTTVRQLSTISAIVAENSTAALAFDDAGGAKEILAALKAEPHVVAAALYDANGKLFCIYPEASAAGVFPAGPSADGYHFARGFLTGFQPVVQDGKRLGTLYVKSDMKAMADRLQLYATVAGLVAVVAFLLAYALSRTLQRQISAPILSLADTARAVSERRDYSVRARPQESGEFGLLTEAFNHMLTHIQEQLARLDLLNRVTRAIGERLDLASIFQVMIGTLEDNLPIDFGCVCMYDSAAERLTVSGVGAKSAALAVKMGMADHTPIPIDQNGLSRCMQGDLVYEPDTSRVMFPFPQRLAEHGLRALVISPLIVESNVFGALITARRQAESFSSLDCEFLRQLSEHAALAAHQARLYGALQQAYDDLRQSQQTVMQQERLRALGQMASGIAHDINNAISPVALYTEHLLEKEPNLSARARDHLQTIAHAIEDVAATVARMREFYRQREPQMTLAPVQLNRALQQVIDLTRARWHDMPQQRGAVITIESDLAPDLPLVLGVEGEIREALTNLFFNAFDAMPEGGTLTLRTRVADGKVFLEISDTGFGMDEETRRRCLEPFYTTKGERGTGLGLAMVYGVVQRHNAEVEIVSELKRGTTIRLAFPLPAAIPGPNTPVPLNAMPPRLRLLVVDDDPMLLKSLNDTLTDDGHSVTTANGGQSGIDTFIAAAKGDRPFEAVITDLGMPYVDGRKVASLIKQNSPATPVILLTGWGQRLLAESDIPPHVDQVLSKPPKLGLLRAALARCAAERKS